MNKLAMLALVLLIMHSAKCSYADQPTAAINQPIDSDMLVFTIENQLDAEHLKQAQLAHARATQAGLPFRLKIQGSIGFKQRDFSLTKAYGDWLDQNQIEVAVAGLCVKECALLFLSAHKKIVHAQLNDRKTLIVLQSLTNDFDEFDEEINQYFEQLIRKNSQEKIPALFFEKTREVSDDLAGVAIVPISKRPTSNVFFSKSIKTKPEFIESYTLDKMGIKLE